MSIDLTKLTPAPWHVSDSHGLHVRSETVMVADMDPKGTVLPWRGKHEDAEFCAMARNAFDVMMRRRWSVSVDVIGSWFPVIANAYHDYPNGLIGWQHAPFADPFTALVEADAWLTQQEKEKNDEVHQGR